ncbi:hypothetical protein AeMF1_018886 [Aphanomyces euteiches]|nr:hypothetical protein AeMF1_018886 [Aphanomyces euteiches]KAH9192826.1 hypothetical protein AeNC1_005208 [Aphanomyces euteiches]
MRFVALLCVAIFATASKISPSLTTKLKAENTTNVVVEFTNSVVFDDASLAAMTRSVRLQNVTTTLKAFAKQSQARVLEFVVAAMTKNPYLRVQSFFVTNRLHLVNASQTLVDEISKDANVERIRLPVQATSLVPKASVPLVNPPANSSWALTRVGAVRAWDSGIRGAGIIVGSIDSGVRGTHISLAATHRKNYGWFDAVGKSVLPIDYDGQGTATAAIATGSRGVAPDATWSSCAACLHGVCTEAALIACSQFLLCPSAPDGTSPKCDEAPHVIHNGWESPATAPEGWFDPVLVAWRAAGVMPIFSSNRQDSKGSGQAQCGTLFGPGASPLALTTVPTDSNDLVDAFVSLGPTAELRVKPDIAAPGVSVLSADFRSDNGWTISSSPALSAAFAAGSVALYLSAHPNATFQDVSGALTSSASQATPANLNCGGLLDSKYPNNVVGGGIVNTFTMLSDALEPPLSTTNSSANATTTTPRPASTPTSTTATPPTLGVSTTVTPSNSTNRTRLTVQEEPDEDTIVFPALEA